jgi:hypothetical protein
VNVLLAGYCSWTSSCKTAIGVVDNQCMSENQCA